MSSQRFIQQVNSIFYRIVQNFKELPLVTKSLIVLFALLYLLHNLANLSTLALAPLGEFFNPIQIITYSLIHFSFISTLFAIIVFWLFAAPIENYWSRSRYLIYLLLAIISVAAFNLFVAKQFLFGSSGVGFALLMAYGMMWPEQRIQLLLPPVPVKGKYLVLVIGVLMALSYVQTIQGRWTLLAYFFGLLCCFLLIQFWRQKPPFSAFNKTKKNHLKRIK